MRSVLFIFLSFALVPFLLLPGMVGAEESFPGIASFAGCSGTDCSACNVVDIVNNGLVWLIGILFIVFAVLLTIAGVRLTISGGNPSALSAAKESFVNAIVGLIIVLSAWLIVDTIMRALVGTSGHDGEIGIVSGGSVTGWLAWSEVECYRQADPDFVRVVNNFWPGDASHLYGSSVVTSATLCDATPAGNVNCGAAEATCRAAGNVPVVDNSSPGNFYVNCVAVSSEAITPGAGSTGCTGGACVPITIPCSARGCNIASDMVSRLAGMHAAAGVSGARVTEGMPPSRSHKSACHSNGTCIDYSKAGGMTASEVARVVSAAQANGLRPVYEVQSQSQKDALVAGGVPSGSVLVLGSWISAPHFSIYGN